MITKDKDMVAGIKDTLIKAGTTFRTDQISAYETAIAKETNSTAKWVLEQILENASIASKNRSPLCDDSGVPHVFIEIGNEREVDGNFFAVITQGIMEGLREMPGRPMAVKGDALARLGQTEGLYDDPGMLVPGPMIVDYVPGDILDITVLMQGGGPELHGRTGILYQRRSAENFLTAVIELAKENVKKLGCTPCTAAIGVGRSHLEANMMMLKAMKDGNLDEQSEWERRITGAINETGVGPLGLGGKTTALGTFLKIGKLRASGFRSVSIRLGCCFEPRKATMSIRKDASFEIW